MEQVNSLLSLFDYSGEWSRPYREAGWNVVQVDLQLGMDIFDFHVKDYPSGFRGILIAPPCDHFSAAGAQYWKVKDMDGRTADAILLVRRALAIKNYYAPSFWALENPKGRIASLVPELGAPRWKFHPSDYGATYTKCTYLWGDFSSPMALLGEGMGIPVSGQKSPLMKLSGQGKHTKAIRSTTPEGFARVFYKANH